MAGTTKWVNINAGYVFDAGLNYFVTATVTNLRLIVVKNYNNLNTYALKADPTNALSNTYKVTDPYQPASVTLANYSTTGRLIQFPTVSNLAVTVACLSSDVLGLACIRYSGGSPVANGVIFVTDLTPNSALAVGNLLQINAFNFIFNQPA